MQNANRTKTCWNPHVQVGIIIVELSFPENGLEAGWQRVTSQISSEHQHTLAYTFTVVAPSLPPSSSPPLGSRSLSAQAYQISLLFHQ